MYNVVVYYSNLERALVDPEFRSQLNCHSVLVGYSIYIVSSSGTTLVISFSEGLCIRYCTVLLLVVLHG